MQKYILTWLFFLCCGILSFAQPQPRFSSWRHEFGVMLWNEPKEAEFLVTNSGSSDLYLVKVHPDCGCTAVDYTRTAIAPGKSGVVKVLYDAAMLGHFEKKVAVYTNADTHPVYLTIGGDVVMEREEYSGGYPYQVGDLYLSSDVIEFDNVFRGDSPTQVLMLYNGGKQSYEPRLMHIPHYLKMVAEPAVVRPGRTGRIYVTLDSEKLRRMGLTQTSVYLSRFAGDRIGNDNEIVVATTLLPEIELNESQMRNAPEASVSATMVELGSMGDKKELKTKVILTNKGKSDLEIGALQVYNPGIGAKVSKSVVKPGKSVPIKITVSRETGTSKGRRRVLLITNDPVNPKIVIDVVIKK